MEKAPYLFDKSLIFSHIPLFSDLKPLEKKLVFDSLEIYEVKKEETIYAQGSPPDAFYCIISGRVEVFIETDKGEQVLEHIYRGKYFGFISLLTGEPHSVSARAVNDTVIARIRKDDFLTILKNVPRLAIDLSKMLSRRLKRKDIHPKSIFESTIISVYGEEKIKQDALFYSLALSYGLRCNAQKKVIFVYLGSDGNFVNDSLKLKETRGFQIKGQFFDPKDIFNSVVDSGKGFDMLHILPNPDGGTMAAFLVSLLTMLVNDYHYCVIQVSDSLGQESFKVLAQCDLVHIVVEAEASSLKNMTNTLYASGLWSDADFKKKTRLIILEEEKTHGKGAKLTCQTEESLFHQPIYATLPHTEYGMMELEDNFRAPYLKVIRRISRQVGEVLVGLALGSGSAMGLSHVGVLKVIEEEGVPIDLVSGSSIGALIGALWCIGYTAKQVEEIVIDNRNKKFLFGLDDFTFPLRGLIRGRHIYRFLKKYLKDSTFCDLKKPFKIVACDVSNMKQVVFDTGRLIDAVMASIAIPGVFEPYRIADRHYIDGGILDPLPTDVLIESGAKKIISVNVLPSSDEIERTYEILNQKKIDENSKAGRIRRILRLPLNKTNEFLRPNIFDVIVSSVQSMEFLLAQISALSQSDVNLHPDMTSVPWAAFDNAKDLIRRGEDEARQHISDISELIKRPE